MTEVSFYHVTSGDPDKTAAKLLEKVLAAGLRAHVYVATQERQEAIDTLFWTYQSASFLPHGTAEKGDPMDHPIKIAQDLHNLNGSKVLVPLDILPSNELGGFDRCLDLFNGTDENAVTLARNRWKAYKDAGHVLTYWRQTAEGQWVKQDL